MKGGIAAHVRARNVASKEPVLNGWQTQAKERQDEMMAKVRTVAEILEDMGHCSVTKLAILSDSGEMNDFQKASINKWLMEMEHEKPATTAKLANDEGKPFTIVLQSSDADL